MKRTNILWVMLLCVASQLHAQLVHENEAAIVYHMPKTELAITLSYECIQQEPGIFYQYAKRYLGANDIVTEKQVTYQLTDVEMHTEASADLTRAYKISAQKGYDLQLVSLTADGRLLGYNLAETARNKQLTHQVTNLTNLSADDITQTTKMMPLLEEQFMAGSVAKMAEGAAKQIYRIRETRLNILGGDVEHLPADGMAMQLVLDELNKQEQTLVELFVGTSRVKKHTHTFYYLPGEKMDKHVIARFSKHSGVVNKDDLSGEPIYLSIDAHKQILSEALEFDPKKSVTPSQVYYNLPGSADIFLESPISTISEHIYVAQYGVAVPLAWDFMSGKPQHSIVFNIETGNISSIQK